MLSIYVNISINFYTKHHNNVNESDKEKTEYFTNISKIYAFD